MSKEFLKVKRISDVYRPVVERVNDSREVERNISLEDIKEQASRCMNCGIPFCHGAGCPLGNVIPEMNAAVHNQDYRTAWNILSSTSSMPEFTSRVCPALCEGSCTAQLISEPVMVRQIEKMVVEYAFANNWVTPSIPTLVSGKRVAVVGSGPSGLSMAIEMNKLGHEVTVFERRSDFGGLLRYGIPSFKLSKEIIDRRIDILKASGIKFEPDTEIGKDISIEYLSERFDAVAIAGGTPVPRDLKIPGRDLKGIYFALDFLNGIVSAAGKKVLIIGGGDTGSDCVGRSVRELAASIVQVEIMPPPPEGRSASTPWPLWPYLLRTSSSQKEGGIRFWNIQSNKFVTEDGEHISGVEVSSVKWEFSPVGHPLKFTVEADKKEVLKADLILLAMGFI
ncbi:MAG: glutamate synthase subunit beta, partial [Victivallaceae bacterium]